MDADAKILKILFCRIPPEQYLRRMRQPFAAYQSGDEVEEFVLDRASTDLGQYSQDEQRMIFRHTLSGIDDFLQGEGLLHLKGERRTLPGTAFLALFHFSSRILTVQAGEPMCRIHEAGLWRQVYLSLGQDLLVCAYLAWEDFRRRQDRQSFAWPAVIRTDHKALNSQLRQGLAENHFHLYGSTQTFALSWCNLMNYPQDLETADWRQFDRFLLPVSARNPNDCLFSSKERVRYASLFRSSLFCRLHRETEALVKDDLSAFHPEVRFRNRVRTLLHLYGAGVPQPNGRTARLDYALEKPVFQADPDAAYRCLAGERSLLYRCFRAFLEGTLDSRGRQMLYLYLVLKLLFRSELMQVNREAGFQNFKDYQDRKGSLILRDAYWTEAVRMGIHAPLQVGNVTSLEARVTPRGRASGYRGMIRDVDEKERCAGRPVFPKDPPPFPPGRRREEDGAAQAASLPYFYVMHFLKQPDAPPKAPPAIGCRHRALRADVRTQAVALARALSNSPWLCGRIRGIDSSSSEIGCPPEVFATAFRFLRDFRPQEYFRASPFREGAIPRLSATYHAGEDFLELAAGLRAVDESVTYLELRRDDRLGHALALGISPEDYYAGKGRLLYEKKQERLDDLVWLLHRGQELGVVMDPGLRSLLAREAETLLLDIYRGENATLLEYYRAMQLRGDDPSLYASGRYEPPREPCDQYDLFKASRRGPELAAYRELKPLVRLYYLYHFGYGEKQRGGGIQAVRITPEYLRLMHQVQEKLQARLAQENIVIECNPSSNVLIGAFGAYRRHPIFRFFGGGLCREGDAPHLHVCVNTDDLGVFDTSLDFEYALLYHALDGELAQGDVKKYQTADVLRYLKDLQEMGHMAVFPSCCAPRRGRAEGEDGGPWP